MRDWREIPVTRGELSLILNSGLAGTRLKMWMEKLPDPEHIYLLRHDGPYLFKPLCELTFGGKITVIMDKDKASLNGVCTQCAEVIGTNPNVRLY